MSRFRRGEDRVATGRRFYDLLCYCCGDPRQEITRVDLGNGEYFEYASEPTTKQLSDRDRLAEEHTNGDRVIHLCNRCRFPTVQDYKSE